MSSDYYLVRKTSMSNPNPRILLNLPCPAFDGTRLSTDVYLPDGDPQSGKDARDSADLSTKSDRYPVILIRTPYSNNDAVRKIPLALKLTAAGYAVAIQDVRGRHDSDGVWAPFFNEAADGLATQAWLASQPFCDGRIIAMGRSYEGYSVWMQAFGHHPALKAIVPIVALPDPVVNVPWMNGSIFWNMITWAMLVHGRTNHAVEHYDWESLYRARPLDRLDERLGFTSKAWRDWMAHPLKDDYWKRGCYMHRMNELDIPALHICGWYDDDGISTFANYPAARALSKCADGQYVLIGPWPHATNTKTIIHGVDFGAEEIIDLDGFIIAWLDNVIKGDDSNWGTRGRARIFIMGENKWRDFDDWPPPGVAERSMYLHSGGNANSMMGDGALSTDKPGDSATTAEVGNAGDALSGAANTAGVAPSDSYVYDPDDPTPYLYDAGTLQVGGPFDARPVQRRDDVLCYTTAPLETDVVICGRVYAELFVSSTAEDTEFVAKLCDVHPSGLARQLCDGNVRLALRDGEADLESLGSTLSADAESRDPYAFLRKSLERLDPAPPGEVVRVVIDMWATGIRIFAGHRIRLEVASAALPKFAAHTNTLDPAGSAVRSVVATNTVWHDAERASRVVLPVVEG
jgi:hypothetical protein